MATSKTTTKRQRKPLVGVKFTSENQPTGQAKSAGKQKKKFTREVLKEMLNMPYKFAEDSGLKKQLIAAFGKDVLDLPIGEIMSLMQMQKAVLKGDTAAYNSVIDQALGRPAQAIINTDEDGNVIPGIRLVLPKGMDISLPSNTDGSDEQ
jgi:hypothetical protein